MRRQSLRSDRGVASVELALLVPIIMLLLAIIYDVGSGFGAGRSAAAGARAAARAGAAAADNPSADLIALQAIASTFGETGDRVNRVVIYRADPGLGAQLPPGCETASVANQCNVYSGADLANLDPARFDDGDCAGSIDTSWCPSARDLEEYLGVAVFSSHSRIVGLFTPDDVALADQAVFPIYFPETSP